VAAAGVLGWLSLAGCTRARDAADAGARSAAIPRAEQLVVMTYNVNFGMAGDPPTLGAIRDGGADVVLLQEVNPAWEEHLRRDLASTYPHQAYRHSDQWPAGGLAVLSRHRFDEGVLLPSPTGWFPAWRIVVDAPMGRVQMLNVHLKPPLSEPKSLSYGYFSTKKDRKREIEAFVTHLDPDIPTIVAGDFNENEGGRAVELLESRGMRTALPDFEPRRATWRWDTSVGTIESRLDHIVYDESRLRARSAHVVDAGRSDHLPVVATLERR
jgi:endonuclease/exonuclease/phosphatase family metal-dependent hydrolase